MEGGIGHFNAQSCFDHDFGLARVTRLFDSYEGPWVYTDVHPRTRIPNDLITGPWTIEMEKRLFWLVRGGAQLQSDQTWELTVAGLRSCLPTIPGRPNVLMLNLLQLPNVIGDWPQSVRDQEAKNVAFGGYHTWGYSGYELKYLLEEGQLPDPDMRPLNM